MTQRKDHPQPIAHSVCAIGWLDVPAERYVENPKRNVFSIEGTGFLVAPRRVLTCAHVIDALKQIKKKRGARPFAWGVQFVHRPLPGADANMSSSFRPFLIHFRDERTDIAILDLQGGCLAMNPAAVVPGTYKPTVGERIGLCGYAHGSALLTRGGEVYRLGPLVQTGIVAALSPFEGIWPESVVLDLHTGPGASGSPVFRWETQEVLGMLVEGQLKGTAAFSIARLISCDKGVFTVRAATMSMARVILDPRGPKGK
jgi:hypothetical protein